MRGNNSLPLQQFTGGVDGIVQAAEFKVLGETFDEADSIASVVTTVATQYGEANVVVLLDQQCASPCMWACLPTIVVLQHGQLSRGQGLGH